ncbi:hypothetical protein Droror1_Dr00012223 [Drosera rotundifolia]
MKKDGDVKMVDASKPGKGPNQVSDKKAPETPAKPQSQGFGSKTLYVGNLPYSVKQEDVENLFKDVGEIEEVRFASDQDDRFKGFATEQTKTANKKGKRDAEEAIEKIVSTKKQKTQNNGVVVAKKITENKTQKKKTQGSSSSDVTDDLGIKASVDHDILKAVEEVTLSKAHDDSDDFEKIEKGGTDVLAEVLESSPVVVENQQEVEAVAETNVLQHYIFPSGGDGLYLVVDEKGKFREDSFQKALNALVPSAEGDKKKENGKW